MQEQKFRTFARGIIRTNIDTIQKHSNENATLISEKNTGPTSQTLEYTAIVDAIPIGVEEGSALLEIFFLNTI